MNVLLCALVPLAALGTVTLTKWMRERWRTRKDKGYNANRYRAF
jgi:hypothetical protein